MSETLENIKLCWEVLGFGCYWAFVYSIIGRQAETGPLSTVSLVGKRKLGLCLQYHW